MTAIVTLYGTHQGFKVLRGKVVRVLLGGSDGSDGSIKVHVAGGIEGLHVEGGVVREGRVKGGVQSVLGV